MVWWGFGLVLGIRGGGGAWVGIVFSVSYLVLP